MSNIVQHLLALGLPWPLYPFAGFLFEDWAASFAFARRSSDSSPSRATDALSILELLQQQAVRYGCAAIRYLVDPGWS